MLDTDNFPSSKILYLRGWRLEAAGARLLADDPRLIKVRGLDLRGNQIGDAGLEALLSSPRLRQISELRLAENGLSSAGVRALAASPTMKELSELDLSGNDLGPDAITELAPLVPRLEVLNVRLSPRKELCSKSTAAQPAGTRTELRRMDVELLAHVTVSPTSRVDVPRSQSRRRAGSTRTRPGRSGDDHSLEDVEVAEDDPQKDKQQDGSNDPTAELPSPSTRNCAT